MSIQYVSLILNTINNRRLLQVRAILPVVVAIFWLWGSAYHHGYYLEVTGNVITEIPIPEGAIVHVSSGPLPDGYKVEVFKDKIVLTEPLPPGTVIHMAWEQLYLAERQVNISTNMMLSPLVNPKLFMLGVEDTTTNLGLVLIAVEFAFFLVDRKKPTVLSIYKISMINIKIQTNRIFDRNVPVKMEKRP